MKHFPLVAAIFEGAWRRRRLGWGGCCGRRRWRRFTLSGALSCRPGGHAASVGVVLAVLKCPWRPLAEIARIMDEMLVPFFRDCRLVELAIIATLAGMGEEMLFRGVIQAAAAGNRRPSGVWLGPVGDFGSVWAASSDYADLRGLGRPHRALSRRLWLASGNLLAPMIAHGAYDFLALAYLVKVRRGNRDKG